MDRKGMKTLSWKGAVSFGLKKKLRTKISATLGDSQLAFSALRWLTWTLVSHGGASQGQIKKSW